MTSKIMNCLVCKALVPMWYDKLRVCQFLSVSFSIGVLVQLSFTLIKGITVRKILNACNENLESKSGQKKKMKLKSSPY